MARKNNIQSISRATARANNAINAEITSKLRTHVDLLISMADDPNEKSTTRLNSIKELRSIKKDLDKELIEQIKELEALRNEVVRDELDLSGLEEEVGVKHNPAAPLISLVAEK